jgi:NAD(P)H dehydrogenase (quinone)
MKIGIIVYSQTGHTLLVAEKLKEKLASGGHEVVLEQITPSGGERQDVKNIRYGVLPDVAKFDALVFASPVQGFSLAPAMAAYLPLLPLIGGKKVACLVTKQLKSAWTGGNRALATMKDVCEAKGGKVCGSGMVAWKGPQRDRDIESLVNKLGCLFN